MKEYFNGLNGLRTIAAFVVLICHLEYVKSQKLVGNSENNSILNFLPDGHVAVVLFFVISGFLITYLLTIEKLEKEKISLMKFYMRRVLRIWPLYYFVLALSYILISANYQSVTVFLSLFMAPNIAHAMGVGWPTAIHVWSIGVEEQFYVFWPILISFIPNKKIILYLIVFFVGYSILPYFLLFLNSNFTNDQFIAKFIFKFFYGTKFNSMSIGCIFGYMYATKHVKLSLFYNKYVAYTAFFLSFFYGFQNFN